MENVEAGAAAGAAAENTPPAAEPKVKAPGVGDVAKQLIRDGKSNKEVLDAIKEQFPDAKTSMASVNWYRNNLRSLGEDVKTAREINGAGKPSKAEEKASKAAAKQSEKEAKEKAKADEKAAKDQAKADEKAAKEQAKADAKAAKAAEKAAAKQVETPAADEGVDPAPATGETGFLD